MSGYFDPRVDAVLGGAANDAVARAAAGTVLDFIASPLTAIAAVNFARASNAYDIGPSGLLGYGVAPYGAQGLVWPATKTNSSPWSCGSSQFNSLGTCTVVTVTPDSAGFLSQFSDTFVRANTSAGDINTGFAGTAWSLLGPYDGSTWPAATAGQITSNAFVSAVNSVVYAWQQSAAQINHLKATIGWAPAGGSGPSATAALIISPNKQPTNAIHCTITRSAMMIGFYYGGSLKNVATKAFSSTLVSDGSTTYSAEVVADPLTNTVTITCNGQSVSATDTRVATYLGNYACWEIYQPYPSGTLMDTVYFKAASYGIDNAPATYTSTVNGGAVLRNTTITSSANTHAMAAIVPKNSGTVAFSMLCTSGGTTVEADFDLNTATGVFSLNNGASTGSPIATVLDLGNNGWLVCGYVKDNNSGNTVLQVKFAPGGRSATGSCAITLLNIQLNTPSVTMLVKSGGSATARGPDSATLTLPNGAYLVTYVFSDGTAPQLQSALVTTGVAIIPALNAFTVGKIIAK